MSSFTFAKSPDHGGYIVFSSETAARSFVLVPRDWDWRFNTAAAARAQIKNLERLAAMSGTVPTRMIETPERFEAVADTRYGPAW